MKVISINLCEYQINALDKFAKETSSSNRSALIRSIIDEKLKDLVNLIKIFELLTPEQIKVIKWNQNMSY